MIRKIEQLPLTRVAVAQLCLVLGLGGILGLF